MPFELYSFFDSDLERIVLVLLLLFAGIMLGGLLVSFRMATNLRRVYISPVMRGTKANLIRLVDEETGEEVVYINPETFKQSLELFITLFRWNMSGQKESALIQSTKRQNRLFRIYVTTITLAILFTLAMVLAVAAVA